MPEPTQVFPIHAAQVARAAEAVAAAFMDDPAYLTLIPDEAARLRCLRVMCRAVIDYCRRFGTVHTTPAAQGAACWFKPGQPNVSLVGLLRTGFALPLSIVRFPPPARRAFLAMGQIVGREHKRHVPGPHWYLSLLGVDPACHGQGIGTALIAPVLAQADAAGLPCYLEALTEPNVAYYEKRGFAVVSSGDLPAMPGVRYYAMRREPGG